ncbi:tyrosine protein kinase receptor torso [Arctopsyche grandis]|uniref:tyrosine protein kinase receptor torso n=1 Tax=Arctopsyche grandis TaxID=121162 RepID=UPI00406D6FB9
MEKLDREAKKDISLTKNESSCAKLCCRQFNDLPTINTDTFQTQPILLCRSENIITVGWSSEIDDKQNIVYAAEITNSGGRNSISGMIEDTLVFNIVTEKHTTFNNLTPDSKYKICLSAFNLTAQLGKRMCEEFWTLPESFVPNNVLNISFDDLMYNNNVGFNATMKWEPAEDRTCYYEILIFSENIPWQLEAQVPENMFTMELSDLEYEKNYSISVKGCTFDKIRESNNSWLYFFTPSCTDFHKNLEMCAPKKPTGLKVAEEERAESTMNQFKYYDVFVSWDAPELIPDFYTISFTNFDLSYKINGTETNAKIENVTIGTFYIVTLLAESSGGISDLAQAYREIILLNDSNTFSVSDDDGLLWSVLIPIMCFLLITGSAVFIYHRHERFKLYKRRCRYFEDLEQKAPKESDCGSNFNIIPEDDPFEMIPEKLVLFEVLGEGAFGVVRKGWIPNKTRDVAVKMLKEDPSAEEVKQFRQEIDMMKSVGSHAHIVSLVGCCTRPSATMMLIVEFCALGDLQHYLRNAWSKIVSKETTTPNGKIDSKRDSNAPIKYADIAISDSTVESTSKIALPKNCVENESYDIEESIKDDDFITAVDLLSFARQIAIGMEFLSLNRVVHRDLAARNVLVCSDKTVKIADFGLSRDIYQENMYKKMSSGKLPIKWMALESLTHQVYTTQSDVWSFGVLFWEIVTLGSTPYPSVPLGQILKMLISGYRMECPGNCSSNIYNLMMECWRPVPKRRPNFTEIRQTIDKLLEGMCADKYLNLDVMNYKDTTTVETASYIPPRSTTNSQHIDFDESEPERFIQPITRKDKMNTQENINNNNHANTQILEDPVVDDCQSIN